MDFTNRSLVSREHLFDVYGRCIWRKYNSMKPTLSSISQTDCNIGNNTSDIGI